MTAALLTRHCLHTSKSSRTGKPRRSEALKHLPRCFNASPQHCGIKVCMSMCCSSHSRLGAACVCIRLRLRELQRELQNGVRGFHPCCCIHSDLYFTQDQVILMLLRAKLVEVFNASFTGNLRAIEGVFNLPPRLLAATRVQAGMQQAGSLLQVRRLVSSCPFSCHS